MKKFSIAFLCFISIFSYNFIEASIEISDCGTIASSSATYILTGDIGSGEDCIIIDGSYVGLSIITIEGQGNTIDGNIKITGITEGAGLSSEVVLRDIIVTGTVDLSGTTTSPYRGRNITLYDSFVEEIISKGGLADIFPNTARGGIVKLYNSTSTSIDVSGLDSLLWGGLGGIVELHDSAADLITSNGGDGLDAAAGGDSGLIELNKSSVANIVANGGSSTSTEDLYGVNNLIEINNSVISDEIISKDGAGEDSAEILVTDDFPGIVLNGLSQVSIQKDATYNEPGATATDDKDGELEVIVSGSVNSAISGTYLITYSAIDDGTTFTFNGSSTQFVLPQTSSTTRTVIVEEEARRHSSGGGGSSKSKVKTQSVPNAPTTNTTPYIKGSLYRDLTVGYSGEDIKVLQKYLNARGFVISKIGAGSPGFESNYFGLLTKAALIKFQASIKLPSTGYFGPLTRGYIQSH